MNDIAHDFPADPAPLGHNNPPEPTLIERLQTKYAADLKEAEDLLITALTVPERIDDEEQQKKTTDIVRKMADSQKRLAADLDYEKKPLEDDVKIIKATFDNPWERLEAKRKEIKALTTDFTKRKDAAEKKRLEEIAAKKREEEALALRLSQDAETAKQNASKAVDAYEQQSNAARMAKASATDAVGIAEADLLAAKARVGKVKADGLQMKADYAIDAKNKVVVDEALKDERRKEYETDLEAAQAEVTRCEQAVREAKDAAAEAKRLLEESEAALRTANKDLRTATADAKDHMNTAIRADRTVTQIEKRMDGPTLGRTVSDYGTGSGTQRQWKCDLIDISLVPLNVLRHLIDPEAIRVAGGKWMRNQAANHEARKMSGFAMYEEEVGIIS